MTENIKTLMIERHRALEKCIAQKDVDGLFKEFYTADAALQGTGVPLTRGADLKILMGYMVPVVSQFTVEPVDAYLLGDDVACDFSRVHAVMSDGTKTLDHSTCIFQRTPEGWRCAVDIFIREIV